MSTLTAIQTAAFSNGQDVYIVPASSGGKTAAFPRKLVFALREAAQPWLIQARLQIESLAGLGENWDSYGANAMNPQSIRRAIEFVSQLAMIENIEAPVIGGTPEGNVGFSWDVGAWSVDAEVLPDGSLGYVYLDERNHKNDREIITRNPEELLRLLTQWPDSIN